MEAFMNVSTPMSRFGLTGGLLLALSGVAAAQTYQTRACLYPHGWNVGDFDRSIEGVPLDRTHQCPVGVRQYQRDYQSVYRRQF
jgi:hypothetical protein